MQKVCSRCGETKNIDAFGKNRNSSDGLHYLCKMCCNADGARQRASNREKNKSSVPPTEKLCGSCQIVKSIDQFGTSPSKSDGYRSECRECRNERARQRYATDEDFRKAESARFAVIYSENREHILERTGEWSKNNLDKKAQQSHRRRARKMSSVIEDFDLSEIREKFNNMCYYCGTTEGKMQIEHVIPLIRGGSHSVSNVVLSCSHCNYTKHTRTPREWLDHLLNLIPLLTDEELINKYNRIISNLQNMVNE